MWSQSYKCKHFHVSPSSFQFYFPLRLDRLFCLCYIVGNNIVNKGVVMPEYQRRHIAVSPEERKRLEEAKKRYEAVAGQSDWGKFLGTMALIGMAGVGIYALARASQRSASSLNVECPECGETFAVAFEGEPPRVARVTCPSCGSDLVVDGGQSEASLPNGRQPYAVWEATCPSCGFQYDIRFVSRPPHARETVTCKQCGTQFTIRG